VRAARFWARYLQATGVVRAFGHPGTESIELLEAAREAGIEFVLTQHEATAAFAASMTGSLTGVPGICITTAGPGATNAASGIAQADLDRMPLIVFTGDHPMGPGQPRHQRLSPDLYGPITRATIRITPATIHEDLPRAFGLALGHPRGPVHVTFPSNEMLTEVGDPAIVPPAIDAPPPEGSLAEAQRLVAAASRPMLLAGLGVSNSRAGAAFRRLARHLGAPVAGTPQARGTVATDDPAYVGTFATHRDAIVAEMAEASDLLITVGLDSVEFLKPWSLHTPVLELTEPGAAVDAAVPASLTLRGPLAGLLDGLAGVSPAGSWPTDEIARYREAGATSLEPPTSDAGTGRLWPQTVRAVLQAAMPDDGIVTVDVGSHKLLMVAQWTSREPDSFLNSSGLSSMGTGLPFAAAARLVHPGRPIAAVIGDGGFLMYAGELATIARLSGPLVIVVMADRALFSIKIKQARRSYPPVGTDLGAVRIADVARAFGLDAERVDAAEPLAAAVARGLAADRPTVIEAIVDPAGYEFSQ
jgi:acetolactate synthase-1/2/3 large subunit